MWVGYGLTAINAWIMSSVFHTMDTPATEKADYFSALATVLASFLAFNLRATIDNSGLTRLAIVAAFVAFLTSGPIEAAYAAAKAPKMKAKVASII